MSAERKSHRCSRQEAQLQRINLPGEGAAEGPPEAGPLRGAAPEGAMAVVTLSLSGICASALAFLHQSCFQGGQDAFDAQEQT